MDEEIWKLVESLNNRYEVSNYGKIRNAKTKKQLKQFENKFGYLILQVRPEPCVVRNIRVHRIVCEAFLGRCPDKYVVNHKDGNKKNNYIENLEYVTYSKNNIHALKTGLRKPAYGNYGRKGEDNINSKIKEKDVFNILDLREKYGYGCRRIGKILNISHSIVSHILRHDSWKETIKKYYNKEIIKNA